MNKAQLDSPLMSCCGLGKNRKALSTLKDRAGALAVFAYDEAIYDYQCFLIDAMLYHLLLKKHPPEYVGNFTPHNVETWVNRAIRELRLWSGKPGSKARKLLSAV